MNWEEYRKEIEARGNLPEEWYILGIDLGTTNSVISYWDNHGRQPVPVDISNGFGKIPLPSVVQFRAGEANLAAHSSGAPGEWVIGEEAYRSFKLYPETTVRSVKRKMGTDERIKLGSKDYLPEEISALILKELAGHVQNLNPKAEIAGLVVSVPYDFDDASKKATMRAVELAGLGDKLICLIEEPKAAALAYNFRRELSADERILVFDFGGGTLDITLFHVTEKTEEKLTLQVISEGGEASHGGDIIDELLTERCYGYIQHKTGVEASDIAPENQAELITRAREAKERLSGVKSFRIPFTFCIPPFVEQITREDFEALAGNFIEKTRKLTLKTLREAYTGAISADMVDRVLLEGGSSQMPWVKNMLIGIFNDENKIYVSERPALDISLGATYYAAMKMGLLQNPDMQTDRYNVEFLVTVPHDIGIELDGAKKSFFPMIRRGTPYEFAKKSQVFTLSGNSPEDMTEFYLKILERIDKEHRLEDCKLIGEVEISGLPRRPSGKTRLKITLMVEEEGGLVKGSVSDLGFNGEFEPSGFNEDFSPERYKKIKL
ncbi:MAG: Hsp70 family protein [Defluviitaleaceae bacterium]|nr:Hsp70 family protein [Defluviitaleaceae bacterium]MCL2836300.1 Hsp70 family protein [Defluviitaleaceae bacterium]